MAAPASEWAEQLDPHFDPRESPTGEHPLAVESRPPSSLRLRGVFEESTRTPLLDFAGGLGLRTPSSREVLSERERAGEKVAQSYEQAAREGERAVTDLTTVRATQATERAAGTPTPPTLPTPPSNAARAFLQPGESILGQLQAALLGIGQMALQAKGLRGSAIGAMVAMKGMAEGWAAGDGERVKREYEAWKANSDRLLAQHRLARESWEDLLTDQKMTWDQIFGLTRVRAEIAGNTTLAAAARAESIDGVLKWYQHAEDLELKHRAFDDRLAQWKAQAAARERDVLDRERHRRELEEAATKRLGLSTEAGARAERGLKLREDTNAQVIKLQRAEIGLVGKLDNLGRVRDAVALLDAEGVLPRGSTFWDKGKAALVLQTKPGRKDIANAVQTIQRLGTALLVGTEVSLGTTGSVMRLKAIGEAEAANVSGIPKAFWDTFLPAAQKTMSAERDMVRRHLDVISRTQAGAPEGIVVSPDEWKE